MVIIVTLAALPPYYFINKLLRPSLPTTNSPSHYISPSSTHSFSLHFPTSSIPLSLPHIGYIWECVWLSKTSEQTWHLFAYSERCWSTFRAVERKKECSLALQKNVPHYYENKNIKDSNKYILLKIVIRLIMILTTIMIMIMTIMMIMIIMTISIILTIIFNLTLHKKNLERNINSKNLTFF